MSGRIDHAAEAAQIAAGGLASGSFDQTRDYLALAQVHATLALVEQVRAVVDVLDLISRGESISIVEEGEPLVTERGTEVRPGDPDPTPLAPEGRWCGAEAPIGPMGCTWSYGHEGAHVAGNGTIAVEVWS